MTFNPFKAMTIASMLLATPFVFAAEATDTATVEGFAHSFPGNAAISNGTITILETGKTFTTNNKGEFGPFDYPVGKQLTLQFKKFNYKTVQSATYTVSKEGLTGPYHNVTFQVPLIETFYLFKAIVGGIEDPNSCHLTTTITDYHKTLNEAPQGVEYAALKITPEIKEKPFYFDIFKSGPFKDSTNPFTKGLKLTSLDGGAAYFNVPPREELYTITAERPDVEFTSAQFKCTKGAFINISPPSGPMALRKVNG